MPIIVIIAEGEHDIFGRLSGIESGLERLAHQMARNQETIMAAIDNLNADIDALSAAITTYAAAVTAALAAAQAASQDPAIDAADAKVKAATQTLADDLAQLNKPVVVPPPAA